MTEILIDWAAALIGLLILGWCCGRSFWAGVATAVSLPVLHLLTALNLIHA